TPALIYAIGGGLWFGGVPGLTGEFGSAATMLMATATRPEMVYILGVRDSVVALPITVFEALPADEQRSLKQRSIDQGTQWVERWLAVSPNDAEAHLWSSRFAELRKDYATALREATAAESLGAQSSWENIRGRRLALLGYSGNFTAAAALADSMLTSRSFGSSVNAALSLDDGRIYAAAALVIAKQWQRL